MTEILPILAAVAVVALCRAVALLAIVLWRRRSPAQPHAAASWPSWRSARPTRRRGSRP